MDYTLCRGRTLYPHARLPERTTDIAGTQPWSRPSVSRVRERERAGEAVRRKKSRPALFVATPIYGEVGAAMTGHFKVNGVGTLWLSGNDEVMANEVGAVMIVWKLWHGMVT